MHGSPDQQELYQVWFVEQEGKMQNCTIQRLRFAHLHQEQPDADEHPLRAEVRKATKCSMRSVMKTGRLAAGCT